ncbi:serine/threonine-protein kinase, partial [Actinoallomurus bryophytorum]
MTGNHVIGPLRPSDPQQLGAYRIVGRLGRGGMGIVYLAENEGGERAAVKVISPDLADDEMFRDRFRREVESARRVRRFCTAPVLDAQLDGEPLFIVTEFVDGADLDEFVTTSGPMRGSNLEHLAVGVATALTAIHGAGVIHRDLKPANVLLSSVGPRVIDFGIARALDTVSGATRTGQFIGTPAYMAPELISGDTASPASDVFAWACVVAFAGTGRAAFDGPTVPSVLYQISHGEPALDGLDEGLRDLVARSLDKDPAKRPSAQELLDLLTGRPHAKPAEAADTVGRTWAVPSGRWTTPDAPPTQALPPGPARDRRGGGPPAA